MSIRGNLLGYSVVAIGCLALVVSEASARSKVRLRGEVEVEVQSLVGFARNGREKVNESEFEVETEFVLKLPNNFAGHTAITAENIEGEDEEDEPARSANFDNPNFFIEELFMSYAHKAIDLFDPLFLYAGKYNPSFGRAWDEAPGIALEELPEDYELKGQIGLGVAATMNGGVLGTGTLALNSFFTDTTFFTQGTSELDRKINEGDGGAGNTERLDNVTVTWDGEDIPWLAGVEYNLGFSFRNKGRGGIDDEVGVVGGATWQTRIFLPRPRYRYPLGVETRFEIAQIEHFNGQDEDRTYLTPTIGISYGPWHTTLGAAARLKDPRGATEDEGNDYVMEATFGHDITRRLTFDLGYVFEREEKIESHFFGMQLSYEFRI